MDSNFYKALWGFKIQPAKHQLWADCPYIVADSSYYKVQKMTHHSKPSKFPLNSKNIFSTISGWSWLTVDQFTSIIMPHLVCIGLLVCFWHIMLKYMLKYITQSTHQLRSIKTIYVCFFYHIVTALCSASDLTYLLAEVWSLLPGGNETNKKVTFHISLWFDQ